jgi:hypothetical protein
MSTFKLEIELGNAEMHEPWHVAEALRKVAAQLDDETGDFPDGLIRDTNGNTVGLHFTYNETGEK